MSEYNSNYEIAQAISERIGTSPIPFDSVYEICLQIYNELGGVPAEFDSVYEILLGILPLVETGAGVDIQVVSELPDASENSGRIVRLSSDNLIYVAVEQDGSYVWQPMNSGIVISNYYTKSEVDEKIATITNTENADIEEKSTIDFTFVESLPASGEEDQYVVINGENQDTLYKYVDSAWVEQTPDANALYFDTEGAALYSYVTADSQFAPVSTVNTIIVSGSLNSNAALKAITTAGTYNVLQHLTSSTRGSYMKNWVLTVQAVDYDEYDSGDSVYQKLVNNVTIYKRTWSSTRSTNDGWTSFISYYEGLVKDTTTSKYYTWSSNKLSGLFDEKQDTLTAGDNITISEDTISAANPIEEVSELPEASENQDKLVRLNSGDKKVYASKLESSVTVTTNKLPDDEQIDKAYLYESSEDFYYYKGAYTLVLSDGEVNGYGWLEDFGGGEWYFYLTEDNAENITQNSIAYLLVDATEGATIDETTKIVTNPGYSINDKDTLDAQGETAIVATYNAPEASQIGNAYLKDDGGDYEYYTGEEIDVVVSDGSIKLYEWKLNNTFSIYTNKKASDIYGEIWWDEDERQLHTLTDFLHISSVNLVDGGFTKSGNTYTNLNKTVDEIGLMTSGDIELPLYDIYIPQLNAPDSEQVGVAYIDEDYIGGRCLYTGVETTIEVDGNNITVYEWKNEAVDPEYPCYSTKPAYQIYNIDKDSDDVHFYIDEFGDFSDESTFNNGDLLSISTVKYQRSETTETWGWDEVINENIINDTTPSATSVYSSSKVDELLGDKANKVDYVVQLNPMTQQYDWTSLNSVTETGVYRISIEVDMMGTVMKMGAGNLFVQNTGTALVQTILLPSDDSIASHVRTSSNGGTSWTDSDVIVPSINDSATTSLTETYSIDKINSLISALETRIAALENA